LVGAALRPVPRHWRSPGSESQLLRSAAVGWRCLLALEIERRFLVAGLQWRRHSLWQVRLRQGYLSRSGDGLTVRVRTSEPLQARQAEHAWLTLKAPPPAQHRSPPPAAGPAAPAAAELPPGSRPHAVFEAGGGDPQGSCCGRAMALSRLEFEYAIPLPDAEAMLALTTRQVVKCRHGLDLEGGDWVLDVFEGANAPLVVAEVELDHADQPVVMPSWCVRELTGLQELSNAALAARPLAAWSEAERLRLLGGL